MANFTFNVAKGRVVEYYNRVKNNDPSASVFKLVPLSASGTQATIIDQTTLANVLANGATELTTGGWVRKTLTDSDLAAFPSPDTANDRYDVSLPAVTWTTPSSGTTTGILVCYDPTGASADSAIIPLSHHDFAVTGDGNNVVLNSGIFFRAT